VSSDELSAATTPGWTWDPSLYAGSAPFYAVGRVGYPAEVADVLLAALALDGFGRLLDVGCGPGSLTLLLAPYFTEGIGVDADANMLIEAARLAGKKDRQRQRAAPARRGAAGRPAAGETGDVCSFHWMDRRRVAARGLLIPGGGVVHVHATTHEGVGTDAELPHPQPPREAITRLVQRYLGPQSQAGQGVLTAGASDDEDAIYRAAGFTGPQRLEVPSRRVDRTSDEIAASVYSLSAPPPTCSATASNTSTRNSGGCSPPPRRRPLQSANAVHRPGHLALTSPLGPRRADGSAYGSLPRGFCRPDQACYPLDVPAQGRDRGGQIAVAGFLHAFGHPLPDQCGGSQVRPGGRGADRFMGGWRKAYGEHR